MFSSTGSGCSAHEAIDIASTIRPTSVETIRVVGRCEISVFDVSIGYDWPTLMSEVRLMHENTACAADAGQNNGHASRGAHAEVARAIRTAPATGSASVAT